MLNTSRYISVQVYKQNLRILNIADRWILWNSNKRAAYLHSIQTVNLYPKQFTEKDADLLHFSKFIVHNILK